MGGGIVGLEEAVAVEEGVGGRNGVAVENGDFLAQPPQVARQRQLRAEGVAIGVDVAADDEILSPGQGGDDGFPGLGGWRLGVGGWEIGRLGDWRLGD
ncbi:MAG: hypothetical protein D6796_17225 [Caldilineae bacterium]|nr:MAG: hypothetical protein D6796_17225 [Caldilineae bacterium]